jgi:glycosyltransferase involved in cell wall biosynthesis
MKKIAAVTMIKDEGDIIELFVRVNSRSVDHLFILDHGSSDNSLQILLNLQSEGYPITLFKDDSSDFHQSLMITALAKRVALTNEYDYIVPLDGDEFIYAFNNEFREIVASQVVENEVGLLAWQTYIPSHGDFFECEAPLYEAFRKRKIENTHFYKVIIPNELAKNVVIGEGNHSVSLDGYFIQSRLVEAYIQHVPVRSIEQITAKSLIGSRRLSIKKGRGKSETVHWDQMAINIRNSNYIIGKSEMLAMALYYAEDISKTYDPSLIDAMAPRIGKPDDKVVYKELCNINLVKNLDIFIEGLCNLICEFREINK